MDPIPRDEFKLIALNFDKNINPSSQEVEALVKLIFEHPDYLKVMDPSVLSRIEAKLQSTGTQEKVIDFINSSLLKDLNNLMLEISNDSQFLNQIGSLQEDQSLGIFQNRLTGGNEISPYTPVTSWTQLGDTIYSTLNSTLYKINDFPLDILEFISSSREILSKKISRLLEDLSREGISSGEIEKGIDTLSSLQNSLERAIKSLNSLKKFPEYTETSLLLKLEKERFALEGFGEKIDEGFTQLGELLLLVNAIDHDPVKELRELISLREVLEGESLNIAEAYRKDRLVKSMLHLFSQHILQKAIVEVSQPPLKSLKDFDLGNLKEISKINGTHVQEDSRVDLLLKGLIEELNPSYIQLVEHAVQIIANMVSPQMFDDLLLTVENNLADADRGISLLDNLRSSSEVIVDQYNNIDVILKIACGVPSEENAGEYIAVVFAKQTIRLALEQLKRNDTEFKTVNFLSPVVNFHDLELTNHTQRDEFIKTLFDNFSPIEESWGVANAKKLSQEAKSLNLDDTLFFKKLISGTFVPEKSVPLKGVKNGEAVVYQVPAAFFTDLGRMTLLKVNHRTVFSLFDPAHKDQCTAYEKLAEGLGEDPHSAVVTPIVGVAISQGMVSDIVEAMTFFDSQDDVHAQTWAAKVYEVDLNENNILTIQIKALSYETVPNIDFDSPLSALVIVRKLQMPLEELKEAINAKDPNLLIHLTGETKVSKSLYIRDNINDLFERPKLINSNEKTYRINKKDVYELLENFN